MRIVEGELDTQRISNWLKSEESCGETSFKGCLTNIGWLTNEMRRQKEKGVMTCIVRHGELAALFKLRGVDTPESIRERVAEAIASGSMKCKEADGE